MLRAIELSKECTKTSLYCVGCLIVDVHGLEIASGFTGEISYSDATATSAPHAEEVALSRIPQGIDLAALTIYSSMEPCSERASGRESCCSRIIRSGVRRVVFAAKEPFDARLKIVCQGVKMLRSAGLEVLQADELEELSLGFARRLDPQWRPS